TRWRLGKSRRRSHRSQRSSASGHTQLWLSIVEVLGASRGKSPLIIEDLDVYPQLPRTTGAPTLNSEEPLFGRRIHLPRTTGAAFTPDGHRVRGHGCAPARYRHGDHRQLLEEPRDDHPARTVPLRAAGPAAAVAAPVGRWSPDPGL